MNKKWKFTFVSLWILLTRSYDAYSTSVYTPDLSLEANPLVSFGGLGWTPLLLILGLLTVYVIYVFYLTVFKPINLLPKEKGYSFSNIVAYAYLGKKEAWYSILYKVPGDLNRFNHYMGNVLTLGLAFAGFVSTIMWLLINYTDFYKEYHSVQLIYGTIVAGCTLLVYFWNKSLYKQYLSV